MAPNRLISGGLGGFGPVTKILSKLLKQSHLNPQGKSILLAARGLAKAPLPAA
jgi:hypothetical protein